MSDTATATAPARTTATGTQIEVPHSPLRAGVAKAICKKMVKNLDVRLMFPDGTVWGAGNAEAPEMKLVRPDAFFARIGADTKIGLGEAYMAGDWIVGDDTDLADLFAPFAARMDRLVPKPLLRFRAFVDENLPKHERNSLRGSRSNIARHYDLSNDLFAEFLDPTMSYSSALFAGDGLEEAQNRKMDTILDAAGVESGTRMLEIGTGWGALAIRAAHRGAHVTTVTISQEQAAYAQRKFDEAGLNINLQLLDYREVQGKFDAIVSVEMVEAVGEEFWPTYFSTLDKLLAPGGLIAIQAITMEHHRYLATRRSYGWIQKYIFPGGLIPSVEAIESTLDEHTDLSLASHTAFGKDYALTLHMWRENFMHNWPSISGQGFDEGFRRMWEFYLAYCEAGFGVGYLNVRQLGFARI